MSNYYIKLDPPWKWIKYIANQIKSILPSLDAKIEQGCVIYIEDESIKLGDMENGNENWVNIYYGRYNNIIGDFHTHCYDDIFSPQDISTYISEHLYIMFLGFKEELMYVSRDTMSAKARSLIDKYYREPSRGKRAAIMRELKPIIDMSKKFI